MNKTARWALSGAVYLALVVGGYSLYQGVWAQPEPAHPAEPQAAQPHEDAAHGNDTHGEAAHGGHEPGTAADTQASLSYENGQFSIAIRDASGKPVEDFQVNHEKLNHLIVVSEDLQEYYHLHPEYQGKGTFTLSYPLKEGAYKAFVDVKPVNASYAVTPLSLQVGEAHSHEQHEPLRPDNQLTKTVEGRKVTMEMEPSSLQAGVPVTLRFTIHDGTPEKYLGALGHVVILNETADQYVHVHPVSETETAFETQFSQPGKYKIWAEFKLNGKVHTYPFVVEVK
ncbi:hypothetical protein [Brevibacillus sp. H7]|uniref:hypothetical protein n=1 Tax=Brevibacillus sp. H7 TaxID=3349138 RepID=UPI0037F80D3E